MDTAVLNLQAMIRIVWQPIAETTSRQVRGAEALARNIHDIAIPNFSNHAIALQCLAQAVEEAQQLQRLGLFTSVNIEPWMVNDLVQLIGEPSGIMLELTERDPMDCPDIFRDLQVRGYQFVIDDWPQGHSPEHLKALASGGLVKISQEHFRASTQAILSRDVSSMHALNMRVVVEGVETDEQWSHAAEAGAEFVQGFHPSLGLPMPLMEFETRFCS